MNWLKSLFGKSKIETQHSDLNESEEEIYRNRGGKIIKADEVFEARISNDFDKMIKAVNVKGDLVDRHFLLQTIIAESYKKREQDVFKEHCLNHSRIYLSEANDLLSALKKEFGELPRVSVFQNYATLLTELQEFDEAIKVCETAISFSLKDGTKGGYESRIERIKKKQ